MLNGYDSSDGNEIVRGIIRHFNTSRLRNDDDELRCARNIQIYEWRLHRLPEMCSLFSLNFLFSATINLKNLIRLHHFPSAVA